MLPDTVIVINNRPTANPLERCYITFCSRSTRTQPTIDENNSNQSHG